MRVSLRKRTAVAFAATMLMTGSAMALGASSASAAVPQNVTFWHGPMGSDGSYNIGVYVNGKLAGETYWKADGDSLSAVDPTPDGWGVGAYLSTSPVREAGTFGHGSPYTATKGGNLPEGHHYKMWACVGGSGGLICSDMYDVHA
ncbi:hypothetical protein ABZ471_24375 [Streptomyces sp. NPDC005728]|uniref:hypothetical protein n=1 Tax=Streptomyces sp. NPDC005728 TaxID=3157054 RepID=UPI0033F8A169